MADAPANDGVIAIESHRHAFAVRRLFAHEVFDLFFAFSIYGGEEASRDDRIDVTAGKIEHLAALFARTWQRPPMRQELKGGERWTSGSFKSRFIATV